MLTEYKELILDLLEWEVHSGPPVTQRQWQGAGPDLGFLFSVGTQLLQIPVSKVPPQPSQGQRRVLKGLEQGLGVLSFQGIINDFQSPMH